MTYQYKTPVVTYGILEEDLMSSVHAMIAGSAGSGKSVLLRRCLVYACAKGYRLALIDPKGRELIRFKNCVNAWGYAEYEQDIVNLLRNLVNEMENRLHGITDPFQSTYIGEHIWVCIDEYADLMCSQYKKEIKTLVQRLAQKGRAALIHVLLCTQRPTADIIDGAIKVNITTRCALHVPTAQDSRNIINYNGAEMLPMHGYAYLLHDSGAIEMYETNMIDENQERQVVYYMEERAREKKAFYEAQRRAMAPVPQKKKNFFQRLFG